MYIAVLFYIYIYACVCVVCIPYQQYYLLILGMKERMHGGFAVSSARLEMLKKIHWLNHSYGKDWFMYAGYFNTKLG